MNPNDPKRSAPTVRPPAPSDLSLSEMSRLADEMEADASRTLARVQSIRSAIYRYRNSEV